MKYRKPLIRLFFFNFPQDNEMTKLRQTIEMLKKQRTSNHHSNGDHNGTESTNNNTSPNAATTYSPPSMARRHTINSTLDSSQSKCRT